MHAFTDMGSEQCGLLASITANHNEHLSLIPLVQSVHTHRGVDRAFVVW